MTSLKDWFCGYMYYFKAAGFMGVLAELFHLESPHHDMYKHAFKEGMQEHVGIVMSIVNHLQREAPTCEPFRHRRKNQIAGFKAALKARGVVMPNV